MIIAFTGKKESGKDTSADYLVKTYGFLKYSFAEPMKKMAMLLFDWTWEQCNDKILKEVVDPEFGFSPRQFLQWIGTDVFQYDINKKFPEFSRLIGRKFWVNKFVHFYNRQKKSYSLTDFVISDLRFPHEIETLRTLETEVYAIRINRPVDYCEDVHESEQAMNQIKVNIELDNSGDFNHLYRLIRNMSMTKTLPVGF